MIRTLFLTTCFVSAVACAAPKAELVSFVSSADGSAQPCWFWAPEAAKTNDVPLLVTMHPWSYDYTAFDVYQKAFDAAVKRGWTFVGPNCRGPNKTPEACGSDLARWHADSLLKHPGRSAGYAEMLVSACGGTPAEKPEEYAHRSPLTHLARAKAAKVPVYVCTGIHDGWKGSVPVGHATARPSRRGRRRRERTDPRSRARVRSSTARTSPSTASLSMGNNPSVAEIVL